MKNLLIFATLFLFSCEKILASSAFPNFAGAGTVTNVSGTLPISSSGGATPAISIANAAADGSTKGAAAFTAADFDASSGVVSIDYANGQKASGSVSGFVSVSAQSFAGLKTFIDGLVSQSPIIMQTSGGTQVDKKEIPSIVQTTDATITSLFTEALSDNTVYKYVANCVARQTNSANRAAYKKEVLVYREAAGSATIQGSVLSGFEEESNTAWDLNWDVSSNSVRLRATGAAASTINWACHIEQQKVG